MFSPFFRVDKNEDGRITEAEVKEVIIIVIIAIFNKIGLGIHLKLIFNNTAPSDNIFFLQKENRKAARSSSEGSNLMFKVID